MGRKPSAILTPREYEVMDAVWRLGEANVRSIQKEMGKRKAGAYTSLASMLRFLERKGLLTHRNEGKAFVYRAVIPREKIQDASLRYVVDTFFGGDAKRVIRKLKDLRKG